MFAKHNESDTLNHLVVVTCHKEVTDALDLEEWCNSPGERGCGYWRKLWYDRTSHKNISSLIYFFSIGDNRGVARVRHTRQCRN